jgi:hypothetical protein
MKNRLTLLVTLLVIPYILFAQKQNNIWYFGDQAGLDFNTTPPTPLQSALTTLEGTASIADPAGQLLFYTNGATVWDRNHNVMPNGSGLLGGESSTQAALIVPLPNSCNLYYLFTTEDHYTNGGLAYSIVDMCLNNGLGDIILASKNTLVQDETTEKATAVLHSNGKDIWIITHKLDSDEFLAFLLTESGLAVAPVVSSVGSHYSSNAIIGPAKASHDGTKIVSTATFYEICEMFDFNPASGKLSNAVDLNPLFGTRQYMYGVEFSPNDNLLYLATTYVTSSLYQVELQNMNVTTLNSMSGHYHYGALQMGTDKKIYMARNNQEFLDVIQNPNLPGVACQYEEGAMNLSPGTTSRLGLPNFAPYSFFNNTLPVFTLGNDTVLCAGSSILLHPQVPENCEGSFHWNDGTTQPEKLIDQAGIYWVEYENVCTVFRDTIRIDFITFSETTINVSICDGESFEGYHSTGIYADTFQLTSGCDSIRILNLFVIQPVQIHIEREICSGQSFEGYSVTGVYTDFFTSSNGCDSVRVLNLIVIPAVTTTIYKEICLGSVFEGYFQTGTYSDTFLTSMGCDSVRIIKLAIVSCKPIIHYDLEACRSYMIDGSHMDYSEFVPSYPNPLVCADITAGFLYRDPPQMNKHSCTPGINGSIAMCVSSYNSCIYSAGNQASVVIEFSVNPQQDSIFRFTGLEFYERAPVNYSWIDGGSGPNNFPKKYGVRILKNGIEIFRSPDLNTHADWTYKSFNFIDDDLFRIEDNTSFRIELLPYCPVGNSADVSAWDLDEIKILGGCVDVELGNPFIQGYVSTIDGQFVPDVEIKGSEDVSFNEFKSTITNESGFYLMDSLERGHSCFLRGYKNDQPLQGLSTLDLITLQRHLLGRVLFTSLHQCIAADINRSSTITVMDLIELQKLLLGKIPAFPNNTSWRFGVRPQEMENTDINSFEEVGNIEYLDQSPEVLNFTGIKIGDVNGDIQIKAKDEQIDYRNKESFTLHFENAKEEPNNPSWVAFYASSEEEISGIQLALDLKGLEVIEIAAGSIPVKNENIFVQRNGILKFSWSSAESIEIAKDERLFSLLLKSDFPNPGLGKIKLSDELTAEAYGKDLNVIGLKLEKKIQQKSAQNPFIYIHPNPFKSELTVSFVLKNECNAEIRFYDLSGRLISKIDKFYRSGENVEKIDASHFGTVGVIYCDVISSEFNLISRLVRIDSK